MKRTKKERLLLGWVPWGVLLMQITALGTATAQDTRGGASTPAYLLPDTVLVQSTKLSLPLSELAMSAMVLSADQIRSHGSPETRELLAAIPGLNSYDLSGSGNQGVVESRGFTSFGETSYLQVLIDGFPVADVEKDAIDWSLLAPSQIERIEVLRGPVSFLYGNSSMVGLVNLVTRRPRGGPNVWGESSGGSHGEFSNTVGGSWAGARMCGSLSVSRRERDGYRDHSAGRLTGAYGLFDARLSARWSLRSRLLLQHASSEIPGPLPDSLVARDRRQVWEPFRFDDERHDCVQPSVEVKGQITRWLEAVGTFQLERRESDATETVFPVGSLDRSTQSSAWSAEGRIGLAPDGRGFRRAMIGVSLEHGHLESRYRSPSDTSREPVGAGDVEQTDIAVFGCIQSAPILSLTLSGGLRGDWNRSSKKNPLDPASGDLSQEVAALSPFLGLNREIPGRGNLYVSAAGSFKNPTLEQLYDTRPYDLDGPGGLPPITLSSSALDPQRGFHLDLGGRIRGAQRWQLETDLYYAKSTDEIGFDLTTFRYDNIEESTHYGLETTLAFEPGHGIAVRGVYAFTRARFDGGENDNNQINMVPKHQIHAFFDAEPFTGTRLRLEIRHVRDQWLDEGSRFPLSAYTVADMGASRRIGVIDLFGEIANLFDERYAAAGYETIDETGQDLPLYFPAPERTFRVGISVESGRSETRASTNRPARS